MTATNFGRSLDKVLEHEGGYVNHPKDPGGATNKGVTIANYRAWVKPNGTIDDLKNITDAELETFYRSQFWNKVSGDALPSGDDFALFDYAVNSGVSRASKHAQIVAGVETVDGVIGPVSRLAIAHMQPRDFIKALCAKRMSFLRSLRIWETFGKGWSRRVADVEATALGWVSSTKELEDDARDAAGKATAPAGGAVVAGGGSVAAPNIFTDFPWWIAALIVAVVVVPLLIRTVVQAQRAAALNAVAQGATP